MLRGEVTMNDRSPSSGVRFSLIVLAVSILAWHLPLAMAQRSTGTIVGEVHDASGAVIPGVEVTIKNAGTNLARTVLTDSSGHFASPALDPGRYTVSASLPGFKTTTVSGVSLGIEQTRRVDLTLEVGGIQEVVEVQGESLRLETDTPDVSSTITSRQAAELPVLGRHFSQLVALVPGVIPALPGGTPQEVWLGAVEGNTWSIGGGRVSGNAVTIDGVTANNTAYQTAGVTPSLDAVQEVKIETSYYSAESRGTSLINLAIRSGGNAVHGTAFDFLRNDALQPRHPAFGGARRPFKYNRFGGTVGGPIYVPKLYGGRDRSFFFFSYEGLRLRRTRPQQLVFFDERWRTGNFADYLDARGNLVTIYDPDTTRTNPNYDPSKPRSATNLPYLRNPFPGNVIPASRIAPQSSKYLELFVPQFAPNAIIPITAANNLGNWTTRFDHSLSKTDKITGRYTQQSQDNNSPGRLPLTGRLTNNPGKNVALLYTRVISPRIVSEFRAAYNRTHAQFMLETAGHSRDYSKEVGFANTSSDLLDRGLPRILFAGGLQSLGPSGSSSEINTTNTYQLYEVLSIARSRHRMTIGVDLRRDLNRVFANGTSAQPLLRFLNGYTSLPFTTITQGHSFADFLLGYPSAASASPFPSRYYPRKRELAFFFQNDWSVTRRLTLNFGLRYEYNQPPRDRDGGGFELDLAFSGGRVLSPNQAYVSKTNTPLIAFGSRVGLTKPDRNDFAPRVGVAWRPLGENTVLRAGYGLFYVPGSEWYFWQRIQEPRLLVAPVINPGDPIYPTIDMRKLFPPPTDLSLGNITTFGVGALQADDRHSYSQQWSLGVQQLLRRNLLVEAQYQGRLGTKLPMYWLFNAALPPADPVRPTSIQSRVPYRNFTVGSSVNANRVSSNYHALQVKVDRRMAAGVGVTASYTWSKSIDFGSDIHVAGASYNVADNNHNFRAERGVSSFDVPHRLVVTYLFEVPFGRGKRWLHGSRLIDAFLGGWQINGITTYQSGFPWTPNVQCDCSLTGNNVNATRPNQVGDPSPPGFERSLLQWTSPGAFERPALGTFGNAGRNILRGNDTRNWDISVFKDFRLREGVKLQLRGEFFNATGRYNGGVPYPYADIPSLYGKIILNPVSAVVFAEKQLALRLVF